MSRPLHDPSGEWLTLQEAAWRLDVHRSTLYRWIAEGRDIPGKEQVGAFYRFSAFELGEWDDERPKHKRAKWRRT
jgi:excisionase family DNA binding protein